MFPKLVLLICWSAATSTTFAAPEESVSGRVLSVVWYIYEDLCSYVLGPGYILLQLYPVGSLAAVLANSVQNSYMKSESHHL